jgi:glycosyltransferase involved in cell wall biosynthesis
VLCLDDGSLAPPAGLSGRVNGRFDWALSGMIHRRSRGTVLSFHRRQIWNPEVEIQSEDIVHLHSITGFIGDRGLRHLLRNRPRVFWTAHNPWLFTGGCVAYSGCDRFESGCQRCPLLKFPLEGWAKGELKAKVKFWRDFGVQPIANSEWMAAMMRRSPLFEGMEIPVVPPIVDEIFTAKALKLKADFTTAATEFTEVEAGVRLAGQAGTSESDSLTSKLVDSPVSESLIRSTDGHASSPATSYSLPVTAPKALGGSRFVVGMSARSLTDEGKGIEEFFQRLPLDRAFLKETTFVLIGDGRICVPAELDCRFLGHVDSPERLAAMYRALDLFVSASAMETFGMAILEAQACGTPVVVFETGGTPEAVCPLGSKLVRNGDWSGLFLEVEKMFEMAVRSGGKHHELSDWVAKRHSWQNIAQKQIEIYNPK